MRSVVLEIKNEQAAVLDDTGVVHAVINRGYTAGQVLNLTETELKRDEVRPLYRADGRRMHRYTGIVAAALALIIIGGSVSAYAAPVSTVKISDGEDAVEYKLNIFDRVVRVESEDKEPQKKTRLRQRYMTYLWMSAVSGERTLPLTSTWTIRGWKYTSADRRKGRVCQKAQTSPKTQTVPDNIPAVHRSRRLRHKELKTPTYHMARLIRKPLKDRSGQSLKTRGGQSLKDRSGQRLKTGIGRCLKDRR